MAITFIKQPVHNIKYKAEDWTDKQDLHYVSLEGTCIWAKSADIKIKMSEHIKEIIVNLKNKKEPTSETINEHIVNENKVVSKSGFYGDKYEVKVSTKDGFKSPDKEFSIPDNMEWVIDALEKYINLELIAGTNVFSIGDYQKNVSVFSSQIVKITSTDLGYISSSNGIVTFDSTTGRYNCDYNIGSYPLDLADQAVYQQTIDLSDKLYNLTLPSNTAYSVKAYQNEETKVNNITDIPVKNVSKILYISLNKGEYIPGGKYIEPTTNEDIGAYSLLNTFTPDKLKEHQYTYEIPTIETAKKYIFLNFLSGTNCPVEKISIKTDWDTPTIENRWFAKPPYYFKSRPEDRFFDTVSFRESDGCYIGSKSFSGPQDFKVENAAEFDYKDQPEVYIRSILLKPDYDRSRLKCVSYETGELSVSVTDIDIPFTYTTTQKGDCIVGGDYNKDSSFGSYSKTYIYGGLPDGLPKNLKNNAIYTNLLVPKVRKKTIKFKFQNGSNCYIPYSPPEAVIDWDNTNEQHMKWVADPPYYFAPQEVLTKINYNRKTGAYEGFNTFTSPKEFNHIDGYVYVRKDYPKATVRRLNLIPQFNPEELSIDPVSQLVSVTDGGSFTYTTTQPGYYLEGGDYNTPKEEEDIGSYSKTCIYDKLPNDAEDSIDYTDPEVLVVPVPQIKHIQLQLTPGKNVKSIDEYNPNPSVLEKFNIRLRSKNTGYIPIKEGVVPNFDPLTGEYTALYRYGEYPKTLEHNIVWSKTITLPNKEYNIDMSRETSTSTPITDDPNFNITIKQSSGSVQISKIPVTFMSYLTFTTKDVKNYIIGADVDKDYNANTGHYSFTKTLHANYLERHNHTYYREDIGIPKVKTKTIVNKFLENVHAKFENEFIGEQIYDCDDKTLHNVSWVAKPPYYFPKQNSLDDIKYKKISSNEYDYIGVRNFTVPNDACTKKQGFVYTDSNIPTTEIRRLKISPNYDSKLDCNQNNPLVRVTESIDFKYTTNTLGYYIVGGTYNTGSSRGSYSRTYTYNNFPQGLIDSTVYNKVAVPEVKEKMAPIKFILGNNIKSAKLASGLTEISVLKTELPIEIESSVYGYATGPLITFNKATGTYSGSYNFKPPKPLVKTNENGVTQNININLSEKTYNIKLPTLDQRLTRNVTPGTSNISIRKNVDIKYTTVNVGDYIVGGNYFNDNKGIRYEFKQTITPDLKKPHNFTVDTIVDPDVRTKSVTLKFNNCSNASFYPSGNGEIYPLWDNTEEQTMQWITKPPYYFVDNSYLDLTEYQINGDYIGTKKVKGPYDNTLPNLGTVQVEGAPETAIRRLIISPNYDNKLTCNQNKPIVRVNDSINFTYTTDARDSTNKYIGLGYYIVGGTPNDDDIGSYSKTYTYSNFPQNQKDLNIYSNVSVPEVREKIVRLQFTAGENVRKIQSMVDEVPVSTSAAPVYIETNNYGYIAEGASISFDKQFGIYKGTMSVNLGEIDKTKHNGVLLSKPVNAPNKEYKLSTTNINAENRLNVSYDQKNADEIVGHLTSNIWVKYPTTINYNTNKAGMAYYIVGGTYDTKNKIYFTSKIITPNVLKEHNESYVVPVPELNMKQVNVIFTLGHRVESIESQKVDITSTSVTTNAVSSIWGYIPGGHFTESTGQYDGSITVPISLDITAEHNSDYYTEAIDLAQRTYDIKFDTLKQYIDRTYDQSQSTNLPTSSTTTITYKTNKLGYYIVGGNPTHDSIGSYKSTETIIPSVHREHGYAYETHCPTATPKTVQVKLKPGNNVTKIKFEESDYMSVFAESMPIYVETNRYGYIADGVNIKFDPQLGIYTGKMSYIPKDPFDLTKDNGIALPEEPVNAPNKEYKLSTTNINAENRLNVSYDQKNADEIVGHLTSNIWVKYPTTINYNTGKQEGLGYYIVDGEPANDSMGSYFTSRIITPDILKEHNTSYTVPVPRVEKKNVKYIITAGRYAETMENVSTNVFENPIITNAISSIWGYIPGGNFNENTGQYTGSYTIKVSPDLTANNNAEQVITVDLPPRTYNVDFDALKQGVSRAQIVGSLYNNLLTTHSQIQYTTINRGYYFDGGTPNNDTDGTYSIIDTIIPSNHRKHGYTYTSYCPTPLIKEATVTYYKGSHVKSIDTTTQYIKVLNDDGTINKDHSVRVVSDNTGYLAGADNFDYTTGEYSGNYTWTESFNLTNNHRANYNKTIDLPLKTHKLIITTKDGITITYTPVADINHVPVTQSLTFNYQTNVLGYYIDGGNITTDGNGYYTSSETITPNLKAPEGSHLRNNCPTPLKKSARVIMTKGTHVQSMTPPPYGGDYNVFTTEISAIVISNNTGYIPGIDFNSVDNQGRYKGTFSKTIEFNKKLKNGEASYTWKIDLPGKTYNVSLSPNGNTTGSGAVTGRSIMNNTTVYFKTNDAGYCFTEGTEGSTNYNNDSIGSYTETLTVTPSVLNKQDYTYTVSNHSLRLKKVQYQVRCLGHTHLSRLNPQNPSPWMDCTNTYTFLVETDPGFFFSNRINLTEVQTHVSGGKQYQTGKCTIPINKTLIDYSTITFEINSKEAPVTITRPSISIPGTNDGYIIIVNDNPYPATLNMYGIYDASTGPGGAYEPLASKLDIQNEIIAAGSIYKQYLSYFVDPAGLDGLLGHFTYTATIKIKDQTFDYSGKVTIRWVSSVE